MPTKKRLLNIAILGATSQIAKSLIVNFVNSKENNLFLFARSIERTKAFIESNHLEGIKVVDNFDLFPFLEYDVVINCVGVGRPEKIKELGTEIFDITERFDNLIIDYLQSHKSCLYINFSSDAAYGNNFESPVGQSSTTKIAVNRLTPDKAYGLAKLNSEAKHRALKDFNVVDLRVFSYFSRYIDIDANFLLSDIVSSIEKGETMPTSKDDIVRDYIHPNDLYSLILLCINKTKINEVFDVYSRKPITKFELFDLFAKNYGFKYKIEKGLDKTSSTGPKNVYYSKNYKAQKIGYNPKYTSKEAVKDEYSKMIKDKA